MVRKNGAFEEIIHLRIPNQHGLIQETSEIVYLNEDQSFSGCNN